MTRRRPFLPILIAAICLLATLGVKADTDLANLKFGTHVTGPEFAIDDLQKRFVIVEYWGINCPPCIRAIPELTKLAQDYGHNKLIVIALHRQGGSTEQVKAKWESKAKGNHVAVYNGGNLSGFGNGRIPNSILFDPYGRELYRGSPSGLKTALKDAIKRFRPIREKKEQEKPDPIVTGIEATFFKRELEQINAQDRKASSALAKIRRAVEHASRPAQIQEGQAILNALGAWAQAQKAQADSALTDDPARSYQIAKEAAALLGKDELGKELLAMATEIEADDQLMAAVRSSTLMAETKALANRIGLADDPSALNRKKYAKDLKTIRRDLRRILKTWPDTKAGQEVPKLLDAWGLK